MSFRTAFTLGAALCMAVPAFLQAGTAPAITTQPAAITVATGQTASFSVTATGTATLRYQWRKNGINISGATSRTYTTPATTSAYNGVKYQVYITNSYGAITSKSALLTVTSAPTLSITSQPTAQTVTAPATATFSVTATGSSLSYQWMKNGAAITGATASSYTTPATSSADNGSSFQVKVSSGTQTLTSQTALLTVISNTFGITTQPKSQTVAAPDGASFTVVASGSNLSYQWRKNGTAIGGATSASYRVAATDLNEISAMYSVVVSSGSNSATSENATLTVMAPNPTYAGDPITVPNRPQTVLPSYTLGTAFPNGSFRFGYDEGLKNPLWTAYANFKFITAFTNGTRSFQADPRLASPQVTDADYSGSGWTRGHQVMMSDLAYRYGAQAGTDTCRLSNIAPQKDTHNNNFWNNLEQVVGGSNGTSWVPGLADKFNRIWIYTGPVFTNNPARFSTKNIAIPTAFYKIIVRESAPGAPKVLAVLAPHDYTPANADLWKYVTSVTRVEELTGLSLFPAPASPLPAEFLTSVEVRGWGAPFEDTTRPNVHVVKPSWDCTLPAGTLENFQGAATSSNSTVVNSSWTFGDGSSASGLNTSHTYNTPGTYTVTFTAQDALGASNSITRVITVN